MVHNKRRILPLLLAALLLLAACGQAAQHADLQKVYEKLLEQPGGTEMIPMNEKRIESYYGIRTAECPQAIVAVSDDGLRVDEIWLIEAESEESAEEILALAQSHIEQMCSEMENYLADQYAVARQARALRIGNTVALLLLPDAGEAEKIFREGFSG